MPRFLRITLSVLVLLAVLVGTALAARHLPVPAGHAPLAASPAASPSEDEGPSVDEDANKGGDALTDAAAKAIVDRLAANGLHTDVATLRDLAARYGVGGAVRLIGWADASGRTLAELRAMRDGGSGWGQMAHELGLHPGIGTWMRDAAAADAGGEAADRDEGADASGSEGTDEGQPESAGAGGRDHAPGQAKPH